MSRITYTYSESLRDQLVKFLEATVTRPVTMTPGEIALQVGSAQALLATIDAEEALGGGVTYTHKWASA